MGHFWVIFRVIFLVIFGSFLGHIGSFYGSFFASFHCKLLPNPNFLEISVKTLSTLDNGGRYHEDPKDCMWASLSFGLITSLWEQRNHGLKYESDCVRIGIGIKIFMNRGSFCKRSFRWVFVIHTTIERKHSFCFRTCFHSRCVSKENCKCLRRNYTPKRENCFAILI